MLFILLPTAWLTVVVLVIAACRMAASSDRRDGQADTTQHAALRSLPGFEGSLDLAAYLTRPELRRRARRPLEHSRRLAGRSSAARAQRRVAAHGIR